MKASYHVFPNYVLRAPILPLSFFYKITSKKGISDYALSKICNHALFREAIYLASPDFLSEVTKWNAGLIKNEYQIEKIKFSILKYLSRASTRSIPFGLFSGCEVGKFEESTKIKLRSPLRQERFTRLDMSLLDLIAKSLSTNKKIRNQILFYPNSSIYKVGDNYRYVDYENVGLNKVYRTFEVPHNKVLERVMFLADTGIVLKDLMDGLIDDEIDLSSAQEFIDYLADNNFLVNELEPSVSGPDYFSQILKVVEKIQGIDDIKNILNEVAKHLKKLDLNIGNEVEAYMNIKKTLKPLGLKIEPKNLFQVDLVLSTENNQLGNKLKSDLLLGLTVLNRLDDNFLEKDPLKEFRNSFLDKYGEREVSLPLALDSDIGIGYKTSSNKNSISSLLDDIFIEKDHNQEGLNFELTPTIQFINRKIVEAIQEHNYVIKLKDEELINLQEKSEDLPEVYSLIFEFIEQIGDGYKLFIGGNYGLSSAKLQGRFCHSDKRMMNLTKKILDIERKNHKNIIFAEIVHVPQPRTGNILSRPTLSEFEIPYMAQSSVGRENQIGVEDLMVSIKQGRIVLRSKKLNKEIIPCLTSSHDFSKKSLPIYNFLCDLQNQGSRTNIGFTYGPLGALYKFLPRIEYRNLIIQKATWNLKLDDFQDLLRFAENEEELMKSVNVFRNKYQIPQLIQLSEGDNELLINLESATSIKLLLRECKNKRRIKLTEFLFSQQSDKKKGHVNQIVATLYKKF